MICVSLYIEEFAIFVLTKMRNKLLKYWKLLGLTMVLTLFAASFMEWSISNEFSGNLVQCEELVDIDVQAENDIWLDFYCTLDFLEYHQFEEHVPGSFIKKFTYQDAELANARFRSFMVLNHQFIFAC